MTAFTADLAAIADLPVFSFLAMELLVFFVVVTIHSLPLPL